ncbi:2-succinyl-6-hydroxy-2,4-cyclohexadiene-1-carboxylate synthase [Schinkia azotoformans MEV2011]|uniref:Putative 2-succinyl-6-hydroxy-2,4-cyclohexadiene-1-carboxylate synthase n=2 Tax=Schinkia azotoformans TaxID=1454 RepID=A0A072NIN2_SCHAZ|nr:2-succinyl-6-hydroxy-2,4-cyclohexadiene-1-carboxylate synthase [Schinkia azotoformans MEV2011]
MKPLRKTGSWVNGMHIKVNGINYHVNVTGEGEPLLLLHGFTGSLQTWSPFINDWGHSFKLILIDMIGHGKTDHPEDVDRYSMENAVRDLKEILHILNITKAHLLGYSMGGRVALSFSILYPEYVLSLILESSSPGLELEEERLARIDSDNQLAKRIIQGGIHEFVDYWEKIPLFFTQEQRLTDARKQAIRQERLGNSSQGLANSLRGMGTGVQPSWWDQLAHFQKPVLILAGEDDQKFCLIGKKMHRLFPNSKILIIKDAGHAIHVEQPEFFGKIVKNYLTLF